MLRGRGQRRGVALMLVVVLMTIMTGLLTLLAAEAARMYRQRQADGARHVARALADSAAAYARVHIDEWSETPPAEPLVLDVGELLPPKVTGSATLSFPTIDGHVICRISTHAQWSRLVASDELDLPLD